MPWIIDYPIVVEQMRQLKLRSLYYNSGAFGFPPSAQTRSIGWIGPPDETIRPEALSMLRSVPEPHVQNLSRMLVQAWQTVLPGRIWVMPASHWAYELDFGSREWLPPVLEGIGIDPGLLEGRTSAAAIEFAPEEFPALAHVASRLLEMLHGSDFTLAFPHHRLTCMLHHHKQLWWTTDDPQLYAGLNAILPAGA